MAMSLGDPLMVYICLNLFALREYLHVFLIQNSMENWYINLRKSLEIQTSLIFSNVLINVSREQGIL